jgi:flagellin
MSTATISQIVTLKDGGFLAVSSGSGTIQGFNSDGTKDGDLINFGTTRSVGEVTALEDGGFMVANTMDSTGDGTKNALMMSRFSGDGTKFEEFQVNNGRAEVDSSKVDVAVLANGDFTVEFNQASGDGTGSTASYTKNYKMESGIRLQIGADLNQALTLELPDLQVTNHEIIGSYSKAVYDADNNVVGETTQDVRWSDIIDKNKLNVTSDDVIGKLDTAINYISKSRAGIAAQQNRLQNTKEGLLAYQDNLTAAESQIRDVDMAKESTNFSKTQVLTNASNAMLAQANGLPNSVLQLLG